jgi:hypothetical protein
MHTLDEYLISRVPISFGQLIIFHQLLLMSFMHTLDKYLISRICISFG